MTFFTPYIFHQAHKTLKKPDIFLKFEITETKFTIGSIT